MNLTKEETSYILWTMEVAQGEADAYMDSVRDKLEKEFPQLKEDRLERAFESWLWAEKVEQDPRVKEIRGLLDAGYEIMRKMLNSNAWQSDSYEFLKEQTHDVLSQVLFDIKGDVQGELLQDRQALREEWEVCRRIQEVPNVRKG